MQNEDKKIGRRDALALLGVTGAVFVAGCGADALPTAPAALATSYGNERGQTYLRGIQTTDANGRVKFTTVYPGWYQGRATHIHVEVTQNGRSLKVTQIAFPDGVNAEVYGSSVYASRGTNPTTNMRDGIFADSLNSELASVTGSPTSGYAATFIVGLQA